MKKVENNKIVKDLHRFYDRVRAQRNKGLVEAVEHLSLSFNKDTKGMPNVVEYTALSGSMAFELVKHDVKCAVIGADENTVSWLMSGENKNARSLTFFEEPISLKESGFVLSPSGGGWKLVMLRDVLSYLDDDEDLVDLVVLLGET